MFNSQILETTNKSTKKSDYLIKCIIVGDSSVGKSNLLLRFAKNTFEPTHQPTLGIEFLNKVCELKGGKVFTIQIWDTAGQENFRSITRAYYKATAISMVVYDITERQSFENVSKWVEDVSNYAPRDVELILVGNKNDLSEQRQVSYDEGNDLANKYEMAFYETSAKNGNNVEEAFLSAIENVKEKIENEKVNLELCGIKKLNFIQNNNNRESENRHTLLDSQIQVKKKKCCTK